MVEPSENLGHVFPGGVADRRLYVLVKLPARTQAPGEFHLCHDLDVN